MLNLVLCLEKSENFFKNNFLQRLIGTKNNPKTRKTSKDYVSYID